LLAELRIVDESGQQVPPDEVGELIVKGPALFREYWRLPEVTSEAFTEDGWYRSGDIARMDERGYIYLMDRRRDMIVSGGINVFPIDVERALMAHSAVAEAAVFGVPHQRWGESVTAVVRLRTGMDARAEELRNWLVSRLASYQVPKTIHLTEEDLPKNASGKVMRREIREPYWRGAARQIS
jgi:acyl-CoA synthetase (AMP-forming)/AMP-acid ligase II